MLDEFSHHILKPGVQEHRAVERTQFAGMILEDPQNLRIHDEARLRHFAQTLDEDVVRQRGKRAHIRKHTGRGVERTDQVLARLGVDTGLAASGCIDHGQ